MSCPSEIMPQREMYSCASSSEDVAWRNQICNYCKRLHPPLSILMPLLTLGTRFGAQNICAMLRGQTRAAEARRG